MILSDHFFYVQNNWIELQLAAQRELGLPKHIKQEEELEEDENGKDSQSKLVQVPTSVGNSRAWQGAKGRVVQQHTVSDNFRKDHTVPNLNRRYPYSNRINQIYLPKAEKGISSTFLSFTSETHTAIAIKKRQ